MQSANDLHEHHGGIESWSIDSSFVISSIVLDHESIGNRPWSCQRLSSALTVKNALVEQTEAHVIVLRLFGLVRLGLLSSGRGSVTTATTGSGSS